MCFIDVNVLGLTDEEIERAIKEAGQVSTETRLLSVPAPHPMTKDNITYYYTWRHIVAGTAIIGGVVGVVIYWIKVCKCNLHAIYIKSISYYS